MSTMLLLLIAAIAAIVALAATLADTRERLTLAVARFERADALAADYITRFHAAHLKYTDAARARDWADAELVGARVEILRLTDALAEWENTHHNCDATICGIADERDAALAIAARWERIAGDLTLADLTGLRKR